MNTSAELSNRAVLVAVPLNVNPARLHDIRHERGLSSRGKIGPRSFSSHVAFLTILMLSCSEAGVSAAAPLIGVTYWPAAASPTGVAASPLLEDRMRRTLDTSQLVQLQLPWTPDMPRLLDRALPIALAVRKHDRQLAIALDWLGPNRTGVLHEDWDFVSQQSQRLFEDDILPVAEVLRPEYFVLGVEVNYYAIIDPDGFRAFVALFKRLSKRIKDVSPTSRVLVTFQYEVLQGYWAFGSKKSCETPTLELIDHFMPEMDIIGISTYPEFVFTSPADIPDQYFKPLVERGSPLGIFETSWTTLDDWQLSQQTRYVSWLHKRATPGFETVLWTAACDALAARSPAEAMPTWFGALGLFDFDCVPKPAAARWLKFLHQSRGRAGNTHTGH